MLLLALSGVVTLDTVIVAEAVVRMITVFLAIIMMMLVLVVLITVVDVLDLRSRTEYHVPDGHENGRVQGHVVDHQRRHDHHLEVGQDDRREAQRDQLWYQHVRVQHHILEMSTTFGRPGGLRRLQRGRIGSGRIGLGDGDCQYEREPENRR